MAAPLAGNTLTITIDDVDYSVDVTSAKITTEKADGDPSFAEANGGQAYKYSLEGTIRQDLSPASFYRTYILGAPPASPVDFLLKPWANETASSSQPHFSGSVKVTKVEGDYFGGDASYESSDYWDVDFKWEVTTGEPTLVTT